ncbi:hypothetical protein ATANTOWER_003515, partial [Ataeniobius toweri]|nr:hypothetical protein [Ataeniobius toweri]
KRMEERKKNEENTLGHPQTGHRYRTHALKPKRHESPHYSTWAHPQMVRFIPPPHTLQHPPAAGKPLHAKHNLPLQRFKGKNYTAKVICIPYASTAFSVGLTAKNNNTML